MLIVGGGYIGLEAASVAAKLGLQVTLVEMATASCSGSQRPRPLIFSARCMPSHGVDIREGVGLERLMGEEPVTGARLSDGTELDVDFVIVGVGIAPGTALADAAGI